MTFTRLRVGTKPFRSKPPRLGPPCTEPYIRGSNILKDPGFEIHSGLVPKGPDNYEFPGDGFSTSSTPGSLYWLSTNITDRFYYDVNGWAVWSNNRAAGPFPVISTANPRSGTKHWRMTYPTTQDWTGDESYPIPINGSYCALRGGLIMGYSARCKQGDVITYSEYIEVSTTTDGPHEVFPEIAFYDENADIIGSVITGSGVNLTTTYAKYEISAIAPADAYALVTEIEIPDPGNISVAPTHFDVDDCVLSVI